MNFLIRAFVKDYEKTENQQVRSSYGILASCVGIVGNLFLFGLKLIVGLLIHSMAVVADAFNNLSDGCSSVISLVAVKMAEKPADEDHPFGHGRMEYVAALVVSAIIIYVGIDFLKSSVAKIQAPEQMEIVPAAVVFLLLSIGVKLWLAIFNRSIGKRINSKVFLATSADALFDVVTTGVTVLSLAIYMFCHINIDGYASLLVSFVVIYAGIGIARDTLKPLIGEPMDPAVRGQIEKQLASYEHVVGVHDLVIHNYGPNRYMASVHMEVSRTMSLEDAHEIANTAEKDVLRLLGIILVVHVDPVELHDKRVLKLKSKVERMLKILDPELSLHDFRVAFGGDTTDISFDMVVPYSYTQEQESRVVQQITELMQETDATYHCVITLDRGALEEV